MLHAQTLHETQLTVRMPSTAFVLSSAKLVYQDLDLHISRM